MPSTFGLTLIHTKTRCRAVLSPFKVNLGLRLWLASLSCAAFSSAVMAAGPNVMVDPKDVNLQQEGPTVEVPTPRESRGLITLEGPSGMFIDPTSATLPQGTFILNYCVFVPTLPQGVGVVGHGILLSYGVRDWLELGLTGDLLDVSVDEQVVRRGFSGRITVLPGTEDTFVIGGPEARIRLLRDREWWPEVSIGAYFHLGTPSSPLNGENAFFAASKTIPICEHGILKSVTFQGGFRTQWLTTDAVEEDTSERGYGGIEVQLPWHLYVIGEVISRDNELGDKRVPWAGGVQWRGHNFGCTIAALQNGSEDSPGLYFGVGGGLGAEPVRTTTAGGVPGAGR